MSILASNYLGISGYLVFWLLFAIALGLFLQRAYFLLRLLRLGRKADRFDHMGQRIKQAIVVTLTQSSNFKSLTFQDPAALGHAIMLWGLAIFGLGYVIFIGLGSGLGLFSVYSGSLFERTIFSILDIVGLLVILSIIWVIIKRYIVQPERLKREQDTEEKVVQALLLTVIMSLMLLHYGIEGFGYAAEGIHNSWPPIGTALANWLVNSGISEGRLEGVFKGLWWLNYVLLLSGIIYAPRSKHLHPLTSFFNLTFADRSPKGALKMIDLQKPESWQVAKIEDYNWKQLLDLYACTWCGRCHAVCPAQLSGKPLSPRELILGMKDHLLKVGPVLLKDKKTAIQAGPTPGENAEGGALGGEIQPPKAEQDLIGGVISPEAIWSCTTCRACQEVCPVSNEHIDKIIDLRRYLQMVATTETAREPLKNLRVRGNPWRGTTYARTDWAEGLDIKLVGEDNNIDVLFWVGCTEALEDRSLKVAQAVARLMKEGGVNFGILGDEEMCCGDPARRLGAEHLFQMLAVNNIQLLQSYNIKKVVTACPHCFNTIKNEYPQLGGQFEVIHHTQMIADLIREGKLKIKNSTESPVTFQEPCYLGRFNDIYLEPRQILRSIPGLKLTEMKKNKQAAFCCGGGGGRMWLEEKTGQRINEMRLGQALESGAQTVVTACPFCLQMLEDAAKSGEDASKLKILDIAELVDESMGSITKQES